MTLRLDEDNQGDRWLESSYGSAIASLHSDSYISADSLLSRGNQKAPRSKRKFSTEGRNKSSEEFVRSSLDNQKDPPRNPAISLIVVDELIQHKAISPDASRSGAKVVALYPFFSR